MWKEGEQDGWRRKVCADLARDDGEKRKARLEEKQQRRWCSTKKKVMT